MGSAGRRNAAYVAARRRFQQGQHPCWLNYPGCTGIGTTPDHDPPLSSFAHHTEWRGVLRPACPACQARQGTLVRQAKTSRQSRAW